MKSRANLRDETWKWRSQEWPWCDDGQREEQYHVKEQWKERKFQMKKAETLPQRYFQIVKVAETPSVVEGWKPSLRLVSRAFPLLKQQQQRKQAREWGLNGKLGRWWNQEGECEQDRLQ